MQVTVEVYAMMDGWKRPVAWATTTLLRHHHLIHLVYAKFFINLVPEPNE